VACFVRLTRQDHDKYEYEDDTLSGKTALSTVWKYSSVQCSFSIWTLHCFIGRSPGFNMFLIRVLLRSRRLWDIGGMLLTGENRSTRRKSVRMPSSPSQISNRLARGRTSACVVKTQGRAAKAAIFVFSSNKYLKIALLSHTTHSLHCKYHRQVNSAQESCC